MERMSSGPSPQGQAGAGKITEPASLAARAAAEAAWGYVRGLSTRDLSDVFVLLLVMHHREEKAVRSRCESPIEVAMLEALLRCGFSRESATGDAIAFNAVGHARLYSQREVTAGGKSYRLDFAVEGSPCYGPPTRIAIECDGHDFHERTKDQARHDRSRDRALTLAGWTVLRFTGSEIHADPIKCASDIIVAARCDTPKGAPMGPLKMSGPELAARTSAAVAAFAPKPRF